MGIRTEDIFFGYGKNDILKGIDMDVGSSEIIGILGPNGTGKTTFLKCLNSILEPRQGKVLIDGSEVSGMSRQDIAKNMSFVPQNAASELCTPTVFEVVLMGRRPHITWQFSKKDEEIVWKCLEEMSVKDLATASFDSLSSGQAQRVLLARALAQEAKVLLLDEPTSNLDVKYQVDVLNTIRNLVKEKGFCACAILHDLDLAMRFCDKVILLKDGEVNAFGNTEEVLTPENIRKVFEVESMVVEMGGRKHVVLI